MKTTLSILILIALLGCKPESTANKIDSETINTNSKNIVENQKMSHRNVDSIQNKIIGIWTGSIIETSAELNFDANGTGYISYKELKSKNSFKYKVSNDSILYFTRGNIKSKIYFKIEGSTLNFIPEKSNKETTDIIYEFTFLKKEK